MKLARKRQSFVNANLTFESGPKVVKVFVSGLGVTGKKMFPDFNRSSQSMTIKKMGWDSLKLPKIT